MIGPVIVVLASLLACGRVAYDPEDADAVSDIGSADGTLFVQVELDAPFTSVTRVAELSADVEDDPTLTGDMLEIYFNRNSTTETAGLEVWRATRPDASSSWNTARMVEPLSVMDIAESNTELAPQGRTIYFGRRPSDRWMLFQASRTETTSPWDPPAPVMELDGDPLNELSLTLDASELRGVLQRGVATNWDLFLVERTSTSLPFTVARELAELNTTGIEESPHLMPDGLALYYSQSPTAADLRVLQLSTRSSVDATFDPPRPVEVVGMTNIEDPWVSPDGRTLYFSNGLDLFTASR